MYMRVKIMSVKEQMKKETGKEHAAGKAICTTKRRERVKCHEGMIVSKRPSKLDGMMEMRKNNRERDRTWKV